ncbi:MAG: NAD(+)--dinitrogen-reductase ADP-D-ribosyltransferase [Deltaproteobacteria bacterium]|nr:NAD(+)--dinitrogen-reductase ADP-D-ribosyltransferase [Deltaproteobacteria bacterium]
MFGSSARSARSLNLCDVSPWAIASLAFNEAPRPLRIQGVRRSHRNLFARLEKEVDPVRRAEIFHDYVDVAFQLHHWRQETSPSGRRSLKNTYLRFLRGWMVDSNSVEGAVLKGWVESRLGLLPTYHVEPIRGIHSEAYYRYTVDRMRGHERTNAIDAQLDLLFEFVQYEFRRPPRGTAHQTLYRGVNELAEHEILEDRGRGKLVLRLNNLNSFTRDFERAWEFGSRVLEARVPVAKIFFRSDLLPVPVLKGEQEVLVIGGEYETHVRTY